MKNLFRSFLCITLLSTVGVVLADDCGTGGCCCSSSGSTTTGTGSCCSEPKTLWFPRSAGDNMVIDQHRFGYKYNEECCTYGYFDVSYRYQRSTKDCRIASSLFGSNTLNFVGSQDATRGTGASPAVSSTALLADNFGLSQAQSSYTIKFNPRVQNHCIDFRLYVGMDELLEGLYMQLNFPLIHTKWNLCCGCNKDCCGSSCNDCCGSSCGTTTSTTTTTTTGSLNGCPTTGTLSTVQFPAGYMSKTAVNPQTSLSDALNGKAFGDFQGRTYGKFSGCCDSTKLAGVYFDLGYNFWECPDYHLGVYLKVVAPTGTDMKCDAHVKNIFHPIVGDYHWQLGAGISGAAELYNCEDDYKITAYLQGYVTHLFEREQTRAFDLNNGVMSRYMLMKEFKSSTDLSYNDKLWSVIDWSTRKAKVQVAAKGEGLIEFVYSNSCGFSAGIGYEIYGRSKEKICKFCAPCNSTMASKTLGLKGCAPVYANGYVANATPLFNAFPASTFVPYNVSATQSAATAYKCGAVDSPVQLILPQNPLTGALNDRAYVNPLTFPGLTNPAVVATDATNISNNVLSESATGTPTINVTTGEVTGLTRAPVILTDDNINKCSASMQSYITNKVYGHIDYIWDDCDWKPSVYAGAEGEFASDSKKNAMNAWGIWIGGGVAF
ncbi:TPA: hypothetical protein DDZ86_03485 [Candidatus Dependentiae bacterium]|nr:MAG: hypothetical protein UW09_C0003G0050 [candidate division TM6 bacterium GW2011_GWF2_43_87]HBL98678.1 hypothetical protein [Candidatus Dependentiae bacterium]